MWEPPVGVGSFDGRPDSVLYLYTKLNRLQGSLTWEQDFSVNWHELIESKRPPSMLHMVNLLTEVTRKELTRETIDTICLPSHRIAEAD